MRSKKGQGGREHSQPHGKTLHHSASAIRSRPMRTLEPRTLCFFYRHYPGKRAETAMRRRFLGPALNGPHGWVRFGGRAYLFATEHLRGVTPDEAYRLGLDERRQLDELLRAAGEVPETMRT